MKISHEFSKILVTGGAGFIGSHIVDRLLYDGFHVNVLDNFSTGFKNNIAHHKGKKNFLFINGDIRNIEDVRKAIKDVDAVIHMAALVSVNRSFEDPVLSNDINVKGTINLLQSSIEYGIKRFILASSCAVYGDTKTLPINENQIKNPISPYSINKLAAEYYTKIFHQNYGLDTVILRYFNVYGPRQKLGLYSGVITIFINDLLKNNSPTIYGNGEQQRDFVNIKDVVQANLLSLKMENAIGEVFNVSAANPVSINNLLEIIKELLDKKNIKTKYEKSRKGDIEKSFADISKIKQFLGYKPSVNLKEGIQELITVSKKLK